LPQVALLACAPTIQPDYATSPWFLRASQILRAGIELHIDGIWT